MPIPAGQRSWKCPECGKEVLLSVTQLDPIACDACLAKLRGAGKSSGGDAVAEVVAGPFGLWKALPETTKLGAVVIALLAGLGIGYLLGSTLTKGAAPAPTAASRPHDRSPSHSTKPADDDHSEVATPESKEDERPPKPGPGYKWVQGRKRKDGTRGDGHWAKDPYYKGDAETPAK